MRAYINLITKKEDKNRIEIATTVHLKVQTKK